MWRMILSENRYPLFGIMRWLLADTSDCHDILFRFARYRGGESEHRWRR